MAKNERIRDAYIRLALTLMELDGLGEDLELDQAGSISGVSGLRVDHTDRGFWIARDSDLNAL